MPALSKIDQLSDDDKQIVLQLLEEHNFADYQGMAEKLLEHDIVISKSSLHRFGSKYAEGLEMLKRSTQVAMAVKESMADDDADLGNIVTQLALSKSMDLLMTMQVDPAKVDFSKLVSAVSKMVAANVVIKEFKQTIKDKAAKLFAEVDAARKKPGGISDDYAMQLKKKFLGITD